MYLYMAYCLLLYIIDIYVCAYTYVYHCATGTKNGPNTQPNSTN